MEPLSSFALVVIITASVGLFIAIIGVIRICRNIHHQRVPQKSSKRFRRLVEVSEYYRTPTTTRAPSPWDQQQNGGTVDTPCEWTSIHIEVSTVDSPDTQVSSIA